MPRCARVKTLDSIFHVMCRSMDEFDLFRDDKDKRKFMELTKDMQGLYKFRIYGYCLMDNHVHLLMDSNGADVSLIMHDINYKYAVYYNKKYDRRGHVFFDRFKSEIVDNEKYLITLSAYIHNNTKALPAYCKRPQAYEFSSLGVYLGLRDDPFCLVDKGFVLDLFGSNYAVARINYYNFVMKCNDEYMIKKVEFENEGTEYRSERKILVRDVEPGTIVEYVVEKMDISEIMLHTKCSRKAVESKALLVLLMRSMCNQKCCEICKELGNITQARVSALSSKAMELLKSSQNFRKIVEDFMLLYGA